MRRIALTIAIVFSATFGRADEPAATASDETRILGSWQLESKTQEGVETKTDASSDDLPLTITFEERTWRAKVGPKGAPIEISGGYSLDSKQTPKLLDVTIESNGNSSNIFGVYKFDKDHLHVRIPGAGGQRPVDFDIAAPDCITLVFRRPKE